MPKTRAVAHQSPWRCDESDEDATKAPDIATGADVAPLPRYKLLLSKCHGRGASELTPAGVTEVPPALELAEAVNLWLSAHLARESDPERVVHIAAGAVGRFLGAARVGYGEFQAGGTLISIPADWTRPGLTSIAGVHAFDPTSEIGRRSAAGKSVVIDDVAEVPGIDRAGPLTGATSRGLVLAPLINDGELVAMFIAADDAPRHWTADEVALVTQTGARIGAHCSICV